MTSKQHALVAAHAADDRKGSDIIIQEVSELLKVTDYFVIVTANNRPQVEAIVDHVVDEMRLQCGLKPVGIEGADEGDWVLIDFGDVVVHVFRPEIRDFYRLETLWGDAPVVDFPEGTDTAPVD